MLCCHVYMLPSDGGNKLGTCFRSRGSRFAIGLVRVAPRRHFGPGLGLGLDADAACRDSHCITTDESVCVTLRHARMLTHACTVHACVRVRVRSV